MICLFKRKTMKKIKSQMTTAMQFIFEKYR